jgi:DNA-binding transcriptional MerR regulator
VPANHLLIGQAALALGIPEHTLRRLCDRGVIDVPRLGPYRVFPVDRLDAYRKALRDAGYTALVGGGAAR